MEEEYDFGFTDGAVDTTTAPAVDDQVQNNTEIPVEETPEPTEIDTGDYDFGFTDFTEYSPEVNEAFDLYNEAVVVDKEDEDKDKEAAKEALLEKFDKAKEMDPRHVRLYLGEKNYEKFLRWNGNRDIEDYDENFFAEASLSRVRRQSENFFDDNPELQEILKPYQDLEKERADQLEVRASRNLKETSERQEQLLAELDVTMGQANKELESGEGISWGTDQKLHELIKYNQEIGYEMLDSLTDYAEATRYGLSSDIFANSVKVSYDKWVRTRAGLGRVGDELGLQWFQFLDTMFDSKWIDDEIAENQAEVIAHRDFAANGLERNMELGEVEGVEDFLEWFTEASLDSLPTTVLIAGSLVLDAATILSAPIPGLNVSIGTLNAGYHAVMIPMIFGMGTSSKNADFVIQEYDAERVLVDIDDKIAAAKTEGEKKHLIDLKRRAEKAMNRTRNEKLTQSLFYGLSETIFASIGTLGTVGRTAKAARALSKVARAKTAKTVGGKWMQRFKKARAQYKGAKADILEPFEVIGRISKKAATRLNKFGPISRLNKLANTKVGKWTLKPVGTFTREFGAEGIEESLTQISQNLIDITLDDQKEKSIFEGVPEAFILGGGLGGIIGSASVGVRTHIIKPALTEQYGGYLASLYSQALRTQHKMLYKKDLTAKKKNKLAAKLERLNDQMVEVQEIIQENALTLQPKDYLLAEQYQKSINAKEAQLAELNEDLKNNPGDQETLDTISSLSQEIRKLKLSKDNVNKGYINDSELAILNNLGEASKQDILSLGAKLHHIIARLGSEYIRLEEVYGENPGGALEILIEDKKNDISHYEKLAYDISDAFEKIEEQEKKEAEEKAKKDAAAAERASKEKPSGKKQTFTTTKKSSTDVVSEGLDTDKEANKRINALNKKNKNKPLNKDATTEEIDEVESAEEAVSEAQGDLNEITNNGGDETQISEAESNLEKAKEERDNKIDESNENSEQRKQEEKDRKKKESEARKKAKKKGTKKTPKSKTPDTVESVEGEISELETRITENKNKGVTSSNDTAKLAELKAKLEELKEQQEIDKEKFEEERLKNMKAELGEATEGVKTLEAVTDAYYEELTEKELNDRGKLVKAREQKNIETLKKDLEKKKKKIEEVEALQENIDKLLEDPSDSDAAKNILENGSDSIEPIILFMTLQGPGTKGAEAIQTLKKAIEESKAIDPATKKAQLEALGDTDPIAIELKKSELRLAEIIANTDDYTLEEVDDKLTNIAFLKLLNGQFGDLSELTSLELSKAVNFDSKKKLTEKELKALLEQSNIDKKRRDKFFKSLTGAIDQFVNKVRVRGAAKGAYGFIKYFTKDDILSIYFEALTGGLEQDFNLNYETKQSLQLRIGNLAFRHLKTEKVVKKYLDKIDLKPNDLAVLQAAGKTEQEIERARQTHRVRALGSVIMQPLIGGSGLITFKKGYSKTSKGDMVFRIKSFDAWKASSLKTDLEKLKKEGVVELSSKDDTVILKILDSAYFDSPEGIGLRNLKTEALRGEIIAQVQTWGPAEVDGDNFRQKDITDFNGDTRSFHATRAPARVNITIKKTIDPVTKLELHRWNKVDDFADSMREYNPKNQSGIALNRQVQLEPIKENETVAEYYDRLGVDFVANAYPGQEERVRNTPEVVEQTRKGLEESHTVDNRSFRLMEWAVSNGYFGYEKETDIEARKQRLRERDWIMELAEGLIGKDFHLLYYYTKSGRMGSYAKYFNHQGSHIAKALHSFGNNNRKAIGRIGFVQTVAQIVDYLGKGKEITMPDGQKIKTAGMTVSERFKVGLALIKDVAMVAENPNLPRSKELIDFAYKNGDFEDFLALSTEIHNIVSWMNGKGNGDPTTYESNYIMWKDATSSGPQNHAAATLDSWTGKLVNLVRSGDLTREDLYTYVGRWAHENLEVDDVSDGVVENKELLAEYKSKGEEFITSYRAAKYTPKLLEARSEGQQTQREVIADLDEMIKSEEFIDQAKRFFKNRGGIAQTRKLIKGPLMIKFYSASAYTMAEQLIDTMSEVDGFEEMSLPVAYWLTKEIKNVAKKYVPGSNLFESVAKKIVNTRNKYETELIDRGEFEDWLPLTGKGFFNKYPSESNYIWFEPIDIDGLVKEFGLNEPTAYGTDNMDNASLEYFSTIGDSLRLANLKRDLNQSRTASSANRTHGEMDAQLIAAFYLAIENISRLGVHDNFGTHSVDSDSAMIELYDSMRQMYEGKMHEGDFITRMIENSFDNVKNPKDKQALIQEVKDYHKTQRVKIMKHPLTKKPIEPLNLDEMVYSQYGYGTQGSTSYLPWFDTRDPLHAQVFMDKIYPKLGDSDKQLVNAVIEGMTEQQKEFCGI